MINEQKYFEEADNLFRQGKISQAFGIYYKSKQPKPILTSPRIRKTEKNDRKKQSNPLRRLSKKAKYIASSSTEKIKQSNGGRGYRHCT